MSNGMKALQVYRHHISPNFFSNCLKATSAELLEVGKNSISFRYTVPESVCRKNGKKQKIMTASAALAVFDELSTAGLLALDKKVRPGVSVNLSTQLLRAAKAGESIDVNISYEKIGRSIAFSSVEMLNEKRQVVATGRHTKFLPIGWFFDNVIAIPWILSLVMNLVYNFQTNQATWLGSKILPGKPKGSKGLKDDDKAAPTPPADVFEEFGLVKMSTVDLDSQKGKNSGGGYTWDLRQHFCNPFGMLHGGAAAMSVEHSAALAHTDNTDTVCTRLDLSYLSSVANKRTAAIVFHNAWGDKVCENKGTVSQQGKNGAVSFDIQFGKLLD